MSAPADRHTHWRTRQRDRGLRPVTGYLPAGLANQLTEQGRRFGLSQSVLLELAVEQALRDGGVLTRPPLYARALQSGRRLLATRPRPLHDPTAPDHAAPQPPGRSLTT